MEETTTASFPWGVRQKAGLAGGLLGGLGGFLLNDGGTFSASGFLLWTAGLVSLVVGFWPPPEGVGFRWPRLDRAAVRRLLANPWFWAVLAVTAVGAFLRIYHLSQTPPGITGDEAYTGINSHRILSEGWIGAYVISGYGIPSGPLYWAAPFVRVLGDTVVAIRLPMALLGIATIPAAYLAFSEMAGKRAGLIGALLLTLSQWHIHYSRMAWPVISWPLLEMVTLWLVFLGFRTGRPFPFLLAGISLGLGVLTYNVYPVFAAALLAFMAWPLVRSQPPQRLQLLRNLALLGIAALIAALPMLREAADSRSLIRNDNARTAAFITNYPAWDEADSLPDRVELLATRAKDYFMALTFRAKLDAAEMLGLRPILDRFTVYLALAGLALMAAKWRHQAFVLVLLMFLVLPIGAVVTVDGMYRRTFGLAPFVSLAAAIPLALVWEQALKLERLVRWGLLAGIVVVLALITRVNVDRYFNTFADDPAVSWSFVEDLSRASEYAADLPGEPYIYLYSGRFGFGYETQRYLAANMAGEDRSKEHGQFSLEADRNTDVVFVFLEPYFDLLPQVQALYPGGVAHQREGSYGKPLFYAYYLPKQATAGAGQQHPGS